MANNCLYEMHVMGGKPDVEEFITVLQHKHPEREFNRVFPEYVNSIDIDDLGGGKCTALICGDCEWAVAGSMGSLVDGTTTLIDESRKLNLEIEVYSEEPDIGFQEHLWYKDGKCRADEVEELDIYRWEKDMTFEEFKVENHLDITQEQLNESNEYRIGGFGSWDFAF